VPNSFDDNLTTTRVVVTLAKDSFHCSRRFISHAREQVTVGVECYGDRAPEVPGPT